MRRFARQQLSSNRTSTQIINNNLNIKLIQEIFDETSNEVSKAFELIINICRSK